MRQDKLTALAGLSLLYILPFAIYTLGFPLTYPSTLELFFVIALAPVFFLLPWKESKANKTIAIIIVLLSLIKPALGILNDNAGLKVSFFNNLWLKGTPEKSITHPKETEFTTLSSKIDFSDKGFDEDQETFFLYFLNDWFRYNLWSQQSENQSRQDFKFSMALKGYLSVKKTGRYQLSVSAGNAILKLGDTSIAVEHGKPLEWEQKAGEYPLNLNFHRLTNSNPSLALSVWHNDTFVPVPSQHYYQTQPNTGYSLPSSLISLIIAAVVLSLLSSRQDFLTISFQSKPLRENLLLWLFFSLATAYYYQKILWANTSLNDQVFSAGNDWLMYETLARQILLGDWLNAGIANGEPYRMNLLYRFILAGMHGLTGDAYLPIVWLQFVVMLATLVLLFKVIKKHFGLAVGLTTLFLCLIGGQLLKFPKVLLDTTFNIFFIILSFGFLFEYFNQGCRKALTWALLCFTIAVAIRTNFIVFIVVIAGFIWQKETHFGRKPWFPICLALILVLTPSFFIGWRNLQVTGQWIMLPDTGATNLWLAHRPLEEGQSYFAGRAPAKADIYPTIAQYILDEPGALVERTIKKASYLIGIKEDKVVPGVLIAHLLAGLGIAALLRRRSFNEKHLLLLSWIAYNYAILCVYFPWGYGWRLSGATFAPLYVFGAIGLLSVKNRFRP